MVSIYNVFQIFSIFLTFLVCLAFFLSARDIICRFTAQVRRTCDGVNLVDSNCSSALLDAEVISFIIHKVSVRFDLLFLNLLQDFLT